MQASGRIVVGFVVSTLLLMLFAGGIQEAFMVLLISIVCTAGIGLVVWIPLWWGVGWLTLTVSGRFWGPGDEGGDSPRPAAPGGAEPASSEELSLVQFLKQAQARGVSRETIDHALTGAGWSEAEILKARSKLGSSSAGVWM
jgi:hypothetical protein